MKKAIWSPRARVELRALVTYLRGRNPAAAKRASAELLSAADQLVRFPEMGRAAGSTGRRERSLTDWHIVMVYRVRGGLIEISTLRDTRRNPSDQVED
jgi:plasmid stabilization system protein ParE